MTDIMIVGEGWNEKEEEAHLPFLGTTGWVLDNMLAEAGISRRECYCTNVLNRRVSDIKTFCGGKIEAIPGLPPIVAGKYLRKEFAPELSRLQQEIDREQPNIIIALGATAAWYLLQSSGLKAIRGSISPSHPSIGNFQVLPTYHPSAVSRQWNLRPIVISDLDKARRHSTHREVRRPARHIWIEPTLQDLEDYDRKFIEDATLLSADIETRQDQITCIGFAPSDTSALVIPFFTESGRSYWSRQEELIAWTYIRRWLTTKPTLFQNGLYDINVLWSRYGIPIPLATEDTMLLHHAYQPEMEKGLGFLATLYTDEASWKFMSKGAMKHD